MENQNTFSKPAAKIIRLGDGAFIQVVMNGETLKLVREEFPDRFDQALEACANEQWDVLYECMRPVKKLLLSCGDVRVDSTGVYLKNVLVNNVIAQRIMQFAQHSLSIEPLCRFLEKLMKNPSKRAVDELYTFLEHKGIPITDNGNFLAYKGVRNDYYSITAGNIKLIKGTVNDEGRIYNGVGEEIECYRNEVCDDKEIGCADGLHAGNCEYAVDFGRSGKVVIVGIDPQDVVSIPTDCSFSKMRICRYKVIEEYTGELKKPMYKSQWETEPEEEDTNVTTSVSCSVSNVDAHNNGFEFRVLGSSWIDTVLWESNYRYYYNNLIEDWRQTNDVEDVEGCLTIVKTDGESFDVDGVDLTTALEFLDACYRGESAGQWFNDNLR